MEPTHPARSWTSRAPGRLVLAAFAAVAVVLAASYAFERVRLKAVEADVNYGKQASAGVAWRKVDAPGLKTPRAVDGREAALADDEEVIGVEAGGRARAYRLRALDRPEWHIVNDLVGGVPVTVAYCDITRCTQAYTDPAGTAPLDVRQAGFRDREMIVNVGGDDFVHRTGEPLDPSRSPRAFPLPSHPWVRTTWKAWREGHPETDVFVGK